MSILRNMHAWLVLVAAKGANYNKENVYWVNASNKLNGGMVRPVKSISNNIS